MISMDHLFKDLTYAARSLGKHRGFAAIAILTIALDTGFQSIGPFNRAFKAHTGMTPTEFRRTRLGEAAT